MNTFRSLIFFLVSLSVLNVGAEENLCRFASYQDASVLKESMEKLKPLIGQSYVSYSGDRKFKYTVGICTSPVDAINKSSAVLQEGLNPDGSVNVKDQHSVGSLSNVHITDGTDWILLEYQGGEVYRTHCSQESKRTMVMISCDENVDNDDVELAFIKEDNSKSQSCFYLFEMKHKAVCPVPDGSGGLSIGSILTIVFFSVFAVYLLVGFLYQRFVLGSKGVEQFPNYEFWKDFGNLQADGCDFVCRSKGRSRNTFGGIGDEQLEPAESVRDDNLLPM